MKFKVQILALSKELDRKVDKRVYQGLLFKIS